MGKTKERFEKFAGYTLNQRGMSLTSAMIAIAVNSIAIGASLAIVSLTNKQQAYFSATVDATTLQEDLARVTSSPQLCMERFGAIQERVTGNETFFRASIVDVSDSSSNSGKASNPSKESGGSGQSGSKDSSTSRNSRNSWSSGGSKTPSTTFPSGDSEQGSQKTSLGGVLGESKSNKSSATTGKDANGKTTILDEDSNLSGYRLEHAQLRINNRTDLGPTSDGSANVYVYDLRLSATVPGGIRLAERALPSFFVVTDNNDRIISCSSKFELSGACAKGEVVVSNGTGQIPSCTSLASLVPPASPEESLPTNKAPSIGVRAPTTSTPPSVECWGPVYTTQNCTSLAQQYLNGQCPWVTCGGSKPVGGSCPGGNHMVSASCSNGCCTFSYQNCSSNNQCSQ